MTAALPAPPRFGPPVPGPPPLLPEKWRAAVLLTPFDDGQLLVAEVTYDWSVQAMRVTLVGLDAGALDLLFDPTGSYLLVTDEPGGPPTGCAPVSARGTVPAPDLLRTIGLRCLGTQTVSGADVGWLVGQRPCTNGYQNPPPPTAPLVSNMFWTRVDNGHPWRMMMVNQTNDYGLPVLGEFPMAHLPTFEPLPVTDLGSLRQACDGVSATRSGPAADSPAALAALVAATPVDRTAALGWIDRTIPGLRPAPASPTLPSWADRMYLTGMTTPTTEPVVYPTAVSYDWTITRMRTRFTVTDEEVLDTYLTGDHTYLVQRDAGGGHTCLKQLPVGLVKPDWPTVDGGVCRGQIVDNPQLSPGRTTQLIVLPSDPPRVFWAWYTLDSDPVLFLEVPQLCDVMLVLTDYWDRIDDPPEWPDGTFDIPSDCLDGREG